VKLLVEAVVHEKKSCKVYKMISDG